jgi:hypothetical protein
VHNAVFITTGIAAMLVVPALAHGAGFAIERAALHQYEEGPVLSATYEFVPGETVYFSCRVTGFQAQKYEDDRRVKVSWQLRITDPSGVLLEKDKSGRIEEVITSKDKEWMPKFLASFVIPPFAPTGVYKVAVKVKDELAGAELSQDLPFHVQGYAITTSETLVGQNFRFLRDEKDKTGMRDAVYHPGETLWARFDITGYKFGENNSFEVDYGLAILNAAGEQVFAQPEAASQSNQSFYPQHYVPGALSLNLQPDVPKQAYTLVVTVRDKVGKQSWETRQPFRVE